MLAEAVELEIKQNTLAFRATCPTCRSKFRPDTGPWVFVAGTERPVCQECISAAGLDQVLAEARRVAA